MRSCLHRYLRPQGFCTETLSAPCRPLPVGSKKSLNGPLLARRTIAASSRFWPRGFASLQFAQQDSVAFSDRCLRMSSAWPEERAFRSSLRDLSTSASRIGAAARLALHDPSHARSVVSALERYVKEAPPAQKLPVLYVVNQICRTASQKLGASEPFTPAFTPRIAEIVRAALAECPVADQAAAKRTVKLWVENRLFPNDLLIPFLGAKLHPPSIPEPKTPPGPPPPLLNAPLPAALAPSHAAAHIAPQHAYYAASAPPMHAYAAPAAPPGPAAPRAG